MGIHVSPYSNEYIQFLQSVSVNDKHKPSNYYSVKKIYPFKYFKLKELKGSIIINKSLGMKYFLSTYRFVYECVCGRANVTNMKYDFIVKHPALICQKDAHILPV